MRKPFEGWGAVRSGEVDVEADGGGLLLGGNEDGAGVLQDEEGDKKTVDLGRNR